MKYLTTKVIGCLVGVAVFCIPAWAVDSSRAATAYPGTLNYVEGQASIGTEALNSKSIGSIQLQPGQSLNTQNGKAEVLLTPGVFLRVGSNSEVKMVSPSLTDTEVQLEKGEATVEVTEIYRQNRLLIDEDGAPAQLVKNGFYDFDANQAQLRVFAGEALLEFNDKPIKVKGGHEFDLNAANPKPHGFDKKSYESSDLYNWSSLRSAYVAEANADVAPTYIGAGGFGPGWIGAGWYWDPWFSCYTFLPADGMFYSPFGWGFYSPFWAFNLGYYRGFGPHYYHEFGYNPRTWGPALRNTPVLRAGGLNPSSTLRGNPRSFGGFQGGQVGGFHGIYGGGFDGGSVGGFHSGGIAVGGGHPR